MTNTTNTTLRPSVRPSSRPSPSPRVRDAFQNPSRGCPLHTQSRDRPSRRCTYTSDVPTFILFERCITRTMTRIRAPQSHTPRTRTVAADAVPRNLTRGETFFIGVRRAQYVDGALLHVGPSVVRPWITIDRAARRRAAHGDASTARDRDATDGGIETRDVGPTDSSRERPARRTTTTRSTRARERSR